MALKNKIRKHQVLIEGVNTYDIQETIAIIVNRIENAQKDYANLDVIDKDEAIKIIREETGKSFMPKEKKS